MSPIRLRLPFLFIFILLTALAARLFYIQVLQGLSYTELAQRQFLKKVKGETFRGDIYDRNGSVLATTIERTSLYIHPKELKKTDQLMRTLHSALSMSFSELESKINSADSFVWLCRKLSSFEASSISAEKIKGLGIVLEQSRYYPNGELACQLIGSVGLDNHGLAGVEQFFDSFLSGKQLVQEQIRDGKGRRILNVLPVDSEDEGAVSSAASNSVLLSIDRPLQYVAEKEIEQGVKETGAERGMAIIQNPQTGEILAMASYPRFDPNAVANGNLPPDFNNLAVLNPNVTQLFEPGSTFKIVTFAAALEEKKFSLEDTLFCEGGKWRVGETIINDHEPSNRLTFPEVLEKSSNIGTAKIGLKIGKETLYRYARAFGFGTKTGIPLPGETGGLLRPPQKWSPISLPIISFGQEIGASALQVVSAFSAIANGGLLMEPLIIKQINNFQNGKKVTTTFMPQVVRRVISEETAKTMQKILLGVVERGTGIHAKVAGYTIAGKTGTAQKIDPKTKKYFPNRYLASFCGFVPAEDPRLVCLVILDEPKRDYWGGTTSAPVCSRMISRAVQILGIPSDHSSPSPLAKKEPILTLTRSR